MAKPNTENPKFEFKKIALPAFIKTNDRAYAAGLYPLAKLLVNGDALFIHNRSMSSVTYAIKAYLETHNKELFFVKEINKGVAVWRVASNGKGVVTPRVTINKLDNGVSIVVDEAPVIAKTNQLSINLDPIEELYPVEESAFEKLYTPSGKRQTTNLSNGEVNDIVRISIAKELTRLEISDKFEIWPATVTELIRKVGRTQLI